MARNIHTEGSLASQNANAVMDYEEEQSTQHELWNQAWDRWHREQDSVEKRVLFKQAVATPMW